MFDSFDRRQRRWPVRRMIVSGVALVAIYGMVHWSRARDERARAALNAQFEHHGVDDLDDVRGALAKASEDVAPAVEPGAAQAAAGARGSAASAAAPTADAPPIASESEYLARGQRMAQHQIDVLNRTSCDKLAADLDALLNDPEFEAVSAYGYHHLSQADKLDAAIRDRVIASRPARAKLFDCGLDTSVLARTGRFEGGQATTVKWW